MNSDYRDLDILNLKKEKSWPDADVLDTLPRIINNLNKVECPTGYESWMIIKKDTLEVIGDLGFKGFNNEEENIDLGYEERRKGYAEEAVNEIIKWAFTNEIVKEITANCLTENISSINLLKKFNFKQVKTKNDTVYWNLKPKPLKIIKTMKLLYTLLLLTITNSVFSQLPSFSGNTSFKPEKIKLEIFDKSKQNIYYKVTFVKNADFPDKKRETIAILQIGENTSKFFDYNLIKKDSIIENLSNLSSVGAKELNQVMKHREQWESIILKKKIDNSIIVQTRAKDRYEYQENQPLFDWKLEQGTKTILDQECNKASTFYRGRKYIAWYAKNLPISDGPFVFLGLPGLIMELEDDQNNFHFLVIAIDKKQNNIYLRNEEKIFKVSRDKYRIIEKSYHDNPSFYMKKAYNEDGSLLNDKIKKIPYNPIELD